MPSQIITPPTLYDGNRWANLRIGLFGGSFNPIHEGHLHVAHLAQIKFDLDFVWWLVTPQNPLKDKRIIRPYYERFNNVKHCLKRFPRQIPTHLESELATNYTFETISHLKHSFSKTDFLWIAGMDNAHIFHKWDRWEDIINTIPIAFIARPPSKDLVRSCPLRMKANIRHQYKTKGKNTNLKKPAIYWLTDTKMMNISSTKIRNTRNKSST